MKKILAIMMTLTLAMSVLSGCGAKDTAATDTQSSTESTASQAEASGEKVTLKVWGSQEDQEMLGEMIEEFKSVHPEQEFDITLGVVGEPDARTKYQEDPAAAADVFAFANDQLYDLVNSGALYEVTRNKEGIMADNVASSVSAAMAGDKLYAYPMSADNGYFLYYDKSVISEEQVKSLDGILEAAAAANKKMFMDVSNGWYIASFFLTEGNTITMEDGKQICDWNNEAGVAKAEAIKKFTADPAFLTGDDDVLKAGFADGSIAAGVSGTWNADDIKKTLGDNYAATKLPTFTVGDKQVQMGSFAGCKLMGVNALTAFPVEAMDLAEWLTNEDNQLIRFQKRAIGPSNIVAAGSDEVKANVALSALGAQAEFATPQKDISGNYWTPAEALGTTLEAKDYSKDIQTLLDDMVAQIQAN